MQTIQSIIRPILSNIILSVLNIHALQQSKYAYIRIHIYMYVSCMYVCNHRLSLLHVFFFPSLFRCHLFSFHEFLLESITHPFIHPLTKFILLSILPSYHPPTIFIHLSILSLLLVSIPCPCIHSFSLYPFLPLVSITSP